MGIAIHIRGFSEPMPPSILRGTTRRATSNKSIVRSYTKMMNLRLEYYRFVVVAPYFVHVRKNH